MEENKKQAMILTIIAVSCLLILVFGVTYAYFQVLATNNVTGTNTQGSIDTMPRIMPRYHNHVFQKNLY